MSLSNAFRQAMQRAAKDDKSTGIYTIYGPNTSDHPGYFVVRLWTVSAQGVKVRVKPSLHANLEEARAAIPAGLSRLERSPADDPVIIENWL